jgi:hypothetical protein
MSVCFSCLTSKDTFFGESHNINTVTVSDIIECLSVFLDGRECEEEEKVPCENARKVRAKVVYYSNLALYNLSKYPQVRAEICATQGGIILEKLLAVLTVLQTDGSSFQDETKLIACSSICNLTTDNINAQKEMIRLQANSKLIGVISFSKNLRLTKMAIACLW